MRNTEQQYKPLVAYDYTIDDYWVALYRRKYIIMFIMIIAAVSSCMISKKIEPQYEASTVFYVPKDQGSDGVNARLPSGLQDHAQSYSTLFKQVQSWKTIHENYPGCDKKELGRYSRDVDVVIPREGTITVFVRDQDPEVAATIANAFPAFFNDFHRGVIEKELELALDNINEKIDVVNKLLREAEDKRQQFMIDHELASLNTTQNQLQSQLFNYEVSLEARRSDRLAIEQQLKDIDEQLAMESTAYKKGENVIQTPLVISLQQQLANLEIEISGARTRFKDDHPSVANLLRQKETAEKNLKEEISRIVESRSQNSGTLFEKLRQQLTMLYIDQSETEVRISSLEKSIERLQSEIMGFPGMMSRYERLQREVALHSSELAGLEAKKMDRESRILGIKDLALVMNRAESPKYPIFPKTPLNVGIAALVGLILGVLYAFLLEHIESRTRLRMLRILEVEEWAKGLDKITADPTYGLLEVNFDSIAEGQGGPAAAAAGRSIIHEAMNKTDADADEKGTQA
jgi:uncharacterized protein involved in exopolysaccharide biosynthesis